MRRHLSSLSFATALLACAALGAQLTTAAVAEKSPTSQPEDEISAPSAARDRAADQADEVAAAAEDQAVPEQKQLHTIPDDDMTSEADVVLPPYIQKILDARPSEDVIICVAGCRPKTGKIVYAQPTTAVKVLKQAAMPKVSEPTSNDDNVAADKTADDTKDAAQQATTKSGGLTGSKTDKAPDAAVSKAKVPAAKPQFLPTVAEPEVMDAVPKSAAEPKSEFEDGAPSE